MKRSFSVPSGLLCLSILMFCCWGSPVFAQWVTINKPEPLELFSPGETVTIEVSFGGYLAGVKRLTVDVYSNRYDEQPPRSEFTYPQTPAKTAGTETLQVPAPPVSQPGTYASAIITINLETYGPTAGTLRERIFIAGQPNNVPPPTYYFGEPGIVRAYRLYGGTEARCDPNESLGDPADHDIYLARLYGSTDPARVFDAPALDGRLISYSASSSMHIAWIPTPTIILASALPASGGSKRLTPGSSAATDFPMPGIRSCERPLGRPAPSLTAGPARRLSNPRARATSGALTAPVRRRTISSLSA